MKKIVLSVSVTEFESANELAHEEQLLLLEARKIAEMAYAPYSQFKVGAAILLENGLIIRGNNQENVAYPSGLCAERVAIFAASAEHPGVKIKCIAITAKSLNFLVDSPVPPCGSCRQVLAEYELKQNSPIKVILSGEQGKIYVLDNVLDLLPLVFKRDELKK